MRGSEGVVMEKKSAELSTSARIKGLGSESFSTNHTVQAAMMIRIDHLDQIIAMAGKLISRVTYVGGKTEFSRCLDKLAAQAKREGLKDLSAQCESLNSYDDEVERVCSGGRLPKSMASEIAKLHKERAILLREILAIKD